MLTHMAAKLQRAAQHRSVSARPRVRVALGCRGRRVDQGGEFVKRTDDRARGGPTLEAEESTQLVVDGSYETFRARVRDTFMDEEWACLVSDEEADFFVRGRWELYAVHAGLELPHSVTISEFPTETSRRSWDAGLGEEDDKAKLHRVFSAEAAVELLRQVDPGVVRGS